MALTKEEAVLGLVLEMLGVEEREDDSVELEVLESIPLFKEYRRKIDWPQFMEKINQDEAEREDCINALKSASKDIQLDALCLANIAMLADG